MKVKETTLTLLILKFLKDPNKYVRQATFTQLGPFIHGLSGMLISEKLIENFCQMAGEDDEEVFLSRFLMKNHRYLARNGLCLSFHCSFKGHRHWEMERPV